MATYVTTINVQNRTNLSQLCAYDSYKHLMFELTGETGDEATSMLPNLVVIEQVEMPKKSFGKKTVEEEESPAIDNNQSLRLQNELEQMSKPPKVRKYRSK